MTDPSTALPVGRRGTHGFVQLAVDTRTNVRMAIKFIPRDQKMQTKSVLRYVSQCVLLPLLGVRGAVRRDNCNSPFQ